MMKLGFLYALAIFGFAPGTALAQESSVNADLAELSLANLDLGREIIALGYPEEMREAMLGPYLDTIVDQMKQSNDSRLDDIEPEMRDSIMLKQQEMLVDLKAVIVRHTPSLMDGLAKAYADSFSTAQLIEIRNFVATPTGQALISESYSLISNPYYTAATQPYLAEVMEQVQRLNMVAELTAMHQEHAEQ